MQKRGIPAACCAGSELTTLNKDKPPPPRIIAHQSSATRGELLVNSQAYGEFEQQSGLNDKACCAAELYPDCEARCSVMGCPKRKANRMKILQAAFAYAHVEGVCSAAKENGHAVKRAHTRSLSIGVQH
jgi:hypothetical protein